MSTRKSPTIILETRDSRAEEKKKLCGEVGIAEEEMEHYSWFIDQMMDCPLPSVYIKEPDPSGRIYYVNMDTNEIQKTHPLIHQFRGMFYTYLNNKEKEKKEGLSEVANQRKGSIQAKSGDKRFLSSPENNSRKRTVSTNQKQGQGSGVKAKAADPFTGGFQDDLSLAKELQTRVLPMVIEKRMNEINQGFEVGPDEAQEILEEYEQIYTEKYGDFLDDVPDDIINSPVFWSITPIDLMATIAMFNMTHYDSHLFWLPRMYLALPLPEGWREIQSFDEGKWYYSAKRGKKIGVRPCFRYVSNMVSKMKRFYQENRHKLVYQKNIGTHYFRDKFGREYRMDMLKMMKDIEQAKRLPIKEELIIDEDEMPKIITENENGVVGILKNDKFQRYERITRNPSKPF